MIFHVMAKVFSWPIKWKNIWKKSQGNPVMWHRLASRWNRSGRVKIRGWRALWHPQSICLGEALCMGLWKVTCLSPTHSVKTVTPVLRIYTWLSQCLSPTFLIQGKLAVLGSAGGNPVTGRHGLSPLWCFPFGSYPCALLIFLCSRQEGLSQAVWPKLLEQDQRTLKNSSTAHWDVRDNFSKICDWHGSSQARVDTKSSHVRATRAMDSLPLKCFLDYHRGALERALKENADGIGSGWCCWLIPPEEGQMSVNVISIPRLGALFMEMADDGESQLCLPKPLARSTSKLPWKPPLWPKLTSPRASSALKT